MKKIEPLDFILCILITLLITTIILVIISAVDSINDTIRDNNSYETIYQTDEFVIVINTKTASAYKVSKKEKTIELLFSKTKEEKTEWAGIVDKVHADGD